MGHNNLAALWYSTDKLSECEAEARQALSIGQRLADDNPAVTEFHNNLADSHINLGLALKSSGKPAEAEAEDRLALAIFKKLTDDNPTIPDYKNSLAMCHNSLGDVICPLGRAAEARDGYDRTVAIRERLVKDNPTTTMYRSHLARSLRHRDLGDPAGAAVDARQALGLLDGLPSRSDTEWFETACCHAALSGLAERDGAEESAGAGEAEATKVMGLLRKAVGMGYRDFDTFRTDLALDPLRERDDFKKLLAELENKSPAKPEKGP
jgi:tetratricopeptide (TPR) repeat protein